MYKQLLLSMIFVILLVGCGQVIETNEGATTDSETESVAADDREPNAEEEDTSRSEEETEPATNPEKESENEDSLTELKVHYIDAGQADATLFQYSDQGESYTILFDTGDWRGNDVVNYLASQDVSAIDLIIVSHPDADHIGQLAEIVNMYDTGEVWMSGNESSSQTFQDSIEAVLASEADYDEPRTGEEFEIGPLEIDVLYPASISGKSNEESISLLFTYGETRFLFTGDADKSGEQEIMNSGIDIQADILQLGHHGSNTSSGPTFIEAVNPSVAIYSAGVDNNYGHPSPEVVSLIQNAGIDLYGTDVHGTIVVTTDGSDFTIATKEDGTISPVSTGSTNNSDETADNEIDTEKESPTGSCISINEASMEEVQGIIHIGPERAQELIDLRPYDSVDDLDRINGIGPARIADIKSEGMACVGGE